MVSFGALSGWRRLATWQERRRSRNRSGTSSHWRRVTCGTYTTGLTGTFPGGLLPIRGAASCAATHHQTKRGDVVFTHASSSRIEDLKDGFGSKSPDSTRQPLIRQCGERLRFWLDSRGKYRGSNPPFLFYIEARMISIDVM